jgi:menaquinone-9 beta-reductase
MTIADVLVIGGGPAGAAAAARLAAGGLCAVLCERRPEPSRQVCGEFVSATAHLELAALGVDPARLGGRPLTRTRICAQMSEVTTRLPFTGHGLSRARLDRSLLEVAARCGADIRMRVGVRTIEASRGAWSATLSDGGRIACGCVVLATGKHDLRGRQRPASDVPPMIGFKMHCRLRPDQAAVLDGAVELFLYDGGYAGLQPIESDAANLCLVVSANCVRGGGRAWQNTLSHVRGLAPALATRLLGAHPLWDRPASIARIPYGYVCPEEADGLYRVGDQAAVVPSLAGEGIAIALRTGRRAADAVLQGQSAEQYGSTIRREVLGAVRRAGMIEALIRDRPLRDFGLQVARFPGVVPVLARLTRLSTSTPAGPWR